MAYSYKEYLADGATDTFALPFEYLAESDIAVYVDGVQDTSFTFNSSNTIQTSTVPAPTAIVRVERNTNIDARAVDFSSGAILTEEDLDASNTQVFYAAQEAIDTAGEAIYKTQDGKFDAQSRIIKNVADPADNNDAVNKIWAETAMSSQLAQATTQATNASNSATAAAASEATASTKAATATTKASEASTSAAEALSSENAAALSETNAASSATTATTQAGIATTKATEASASATSASNSATTATTQANVATSAASTATTQATSATNSANSAATSATTATSQAASATTSATSAANSASQAQGYRDTTLGYRDSAATSATSALSSKNAAATSETNAAASATTATTKASEASASAVSAAQSAASAASVLDNFDDRYLGAKTADPSVDNDGDPLVVGALYFNTTDGVMKTYTASGWLAASSASVATMMKYNFTATSGQTAFTGSDDNTETLSITVGSEIVTLNGIVLESGTDYTPASGSITLATGASAGDELNVFAFGNFQVADTVSASAGGTFQNDIDVVGTVTADGLRVDGVTNIGFTTAPTWDTNSYLWSESGVGLNVDGYNLKFNTGPTRNESMRIDSSGNVGIGTSSPAAKLDIQGNDPGVQMAIRNWPMLSVGNPTALEFGGVNASQWQAVKFYTDGTERMRIDSAGRVTMPYQPAFRAVNTTPLTIDSNAGTYKIPYSYTVTNIGGHYNSSQARFTAPVDGFYYFSADVQISGGNINTFSYLFIRFHVNGTDIQQEKMMPRPSGGSYATVQVNMGIYLNAGDYVEPFIRQASGSVVTVRTDQRTFSGYLVG